MIEVVGFARIDRRRIVLVIYEAIEMELGPAAYELWGDVISESTGQYGRLTTYVCV